MMILVSGSLGQGPRSEPCRRALTERARDPSAQQGLCAGVARAGDEELALGFASFPEGGAAPSA